jgi:hypothetical protein
MLIEIGNANNRMSEIRKESLKVLNSLMPTDRAEVLAVVMIATE